VERIVLRNDEGLGPWNNFYYNRKDFPKKHNVFQSGHFLELQSLVLGATLRGPRSRGEERDGGGGGGGSNTVDVVGVSYSGDGADITKVEVGQRVSFVCSYHRYNNCVYPIY
jgi:hypothetical protein